MHHDKVKGLHLRDLFSADHKRGERLTALICRYRRYRPKNF